MEQWVNHRMVIELFEGSCGAKILFGNRVVFFMHYMNVALYLW